MGSEVEEVNRDISHNTVRTQLGRISVPGRNLQQWKRFLTVEKCHEIYLVFCYINQEQLPCTSMMAALTNYQLLNILNSTNFTQITAFLCVHLASSATFHFCMLCSYWGACALFAFAWCLIPPWFHPAYDINLNTLALLSFSQCPHLPFCFLSS